MKPRELPARFAVVAIRLYQLMLSPYVGRQCRFHPTCSQYAREAIERYGLLRGAWLALCRIGRCHPFHAGGFDPVPAAGGTVAHCAAGDGSDGRRVPHTGASFHEKES